MPDDPNQNGDDVDRQDTDSNKPGRGPGEGPVPVPGIVFVASYHVLAIIFCLYGLLVFWPAPTPAGGQQANQPPTKQTDSTTSTGESKTPSRSPQRSATATPSVTPTAEQSAASPASTLPLVLSTSTSPSPSAAPSATATPSPSPTPTASPGKAKAFGKEFEVWDEVRLLWIVMLAGALGSLIHALRSVYWYVGNRKFVWSWIGKYLVMPFSGGALAVVFYFVVRGGFFSPQAGFANTSPFGFAAMAALVGLFSEQAVLKLQQIAETVFTKPLAGEDSKPQKTVSK
jgi:hypothetical protein